MSASGRGSILAGEGACAPSRDAQELPINQESDVYD